jgi:hypothetical protein
VVKLAIVLSRRDDLSLARALTEAALRAGDPVRWFAMAEGVEALAALAPPPPLADEPTGPLGAEVEVIACATSADQRGLSLPAWITLGSQDDHAALLAWADRTVALT